MVHVKEGTTDDLLVVGVMLDASTYGINSKVRVFGVTRWYETRLRKLRKFHRKRVPHCCHFPFSPRFLFDVELRLLSGVVAFVGWHPARSIPGLVLRTDSACRRRKMERNNACCVNVWTTRPPFRSPPPHLSNILRASEHTAFSTPPPRLRSLLRVRCSPPSISGSPSSHHQLIDMWSVLAEDLEEAPVDADWVLSPYELLPAGPNYSHYMGSLTTPPCTEVKRLRKRRMKSQRARRVWQQAASDHPPGFGHNPTFVFFYAVYPGGISSWQLPDLSRRKVQSVPFVRQWYEIARPEPQALSLLAPRTALHPSTTANGGETT